MLAPAAPHSPGGVGGGGVQVTSEMRGGWWCWWWVGVAGESRTAHRPPGGLVVFQLLADRADRQQVAEACICVGKCT